MSRSSVEGLRDSLSDQGYALVEHVGGQRQAVELLQDLGRFVPQYGGTVEHEVVYRPGNDGRAYSQSRNAIRPHTEAPGRHPSPRHLALYCHRQARCGGGHTDLLDWKLLEKLLGPDDLALVTGPRVRFPGPVGGEGVVATMVEEDGDRAVLRFSHNLLTAADYDPALDAATPAEELPLGRAGAELALRVAELFVHYRTQVLIPDDALLVWDNQRMMHARSQYEDTGRHLTRYWVAV
ncbi:TauD/TfdA family dioxygenase [Streptomyces sp. NBS 14/10]|uniref:TauD/TfdA family dioxygenase n=1 Tax=Streptomyces sp. NBS 14/10 TaxID=1945643 RepID=UPI000B800234|nr:TauD/TfdA family dioxygenase [Streptomyces sp. NBS 14/10]KAK1184030.1 TauD/TfdA family dioxygenase [Streptomyces sp. NBS 14/10]